MTKSELIEALSSTAKITKSHAEQLVDSVFESMTGALKRGENIEIRGFGSFTVKNYKGYNGRNPRTGETVAVAPKKLPFFKVGKALKELVDNAASAAPSQASDSAAD